MSIVLDMDDYDLRAMHQAAAEFGYDRYGYVVTPNVDHLIRYHDDPNFRELYAEAEFVVLDSRVVHYLTALVKRVKIKVCPGSDLTAQVFSHVASPDDRLVLVGSTSAQVAQLRQQYGLRNLVHIDVPMGFIRDPVAVEKCLQQIEAASPFRFCFLAVGSPQQEKVAQLLKSRGVARGLAMCIGASINFLTGAERRAPRWIQMISMEWLFRMLQDPRRLAARYLIRGPRFFLMLPSFEFRVRPAKALTV